MKKLLAQYFNLYVFILVIGISFTGHLIFKKNQIFDLEFEEFSKRYKNSLNKKMVVYNLSDHSEMNFSKIFFFVKYIRQNIDVDNLEYISFDFYEESFSFNRFILLYSQKNDNTLDGYFENENPILLARFILNCQNCDKNSEKYIEPPFFQIFDRRVLPKGLKLKDNELRIREIENGKLVVIPK